VAPGLAERAAVPSHVAFEDGFPPLRTPDEVVDDEVDAVFVASGFPVEGIQAFNTGYKCAARKRTGGNPKTRDPPHRPR